MKKGVAFMMCAVCTAQVLITGCSTDGKKQASFAKTESVENTVDEPLYEWGKISDSTITIWSKEGELDRAYMKKAFERYETLTSNKLKIIEIPGNKFEETVADALSSDDSEKPDVLLSYGGTNIEKFMPDKNFYDFTNAPWVKDLTMTSINQTIYDGKIIGLPHWEASISGTIYNKDIFDKLNLKVPKTQSEFMVVCDKLLQNGITPVFLPYAEISMLLYQFPLDTIVQDTKIIESINNGTLNYEDISDMETIVQWYRDMSDKGYFGNDYVNNSWNMMSPAMESEEYAMMLCWDTWLFSDFKGEPSKFGLMPAFVGIPENGTFEGPNLGLLIANKNGSKIDAALDFITFMADPYNYNVAFDGMYTAPVFKQQVRSISTPQYVECERLIEKNFRSSTAWLRIRGFSQMDASFIQKYMMGEYGYTAKDCLRDMDNSRINRIFN